MVDKYKRSQSSKSFLTRPGSSSSRSAPKQETRDKPAQRQQKPKPVVCCGRYPGYVRSAAHSQQQPPAEGGGYPGAGATYYLVCERR